jgi:hypothetical protein
MGKRMNISKHLYTIWTMILQKTNLEFEELYKALDK